eukprot:3334307-Alexandrium_andersonii.AAC.1
MATDRLALQDLSSPLVKRGQSRLWWKVPALQLVDLSPEVSPHLLMALLRVATLRLLRLVHPTMRRRCRHSWGVQ